MASKQMTYILFVTLALSVAAAFISTAAEGDSSVPQLSANLFRQNKIWDIQLKLTPDQWTALQPEEPEGGGPFGGGPPGGGRGPGGGGRGFNPAMFIAPAFMSALDQDNNSELSRIEFVGGFDRWFKAWNANPSGQIDLDQLRTGLNQSLAPGPGGPGGGRGGGPGGASFLQGRNGSRNGLSAARGIDFKFVHADLEFGGSTFKDVGVRYKGNGTYMQSRGSEKRSFKLDLDHYVKGQKVSESSKLNLHNCVTDASWMNEVLALQLYRDAGVAAPRTAYARLRVTVPGVHDNKYFGLYSVVENEDAHFLEENYGSKKGALFKPVTPRLFDDLGDDWSKYIQIYDPKTIVSEKQARRVIEFARLVTRADDSEFASKVGDYLDLDQFSRFMAVTAWLSTLDSILGMGQNFIVYLHPKTHKFHFMPWDLDHSFGQFGMVGSQEEREELSIQQPWQGSVWFLERIYKVDAFQKLYRARLDEFSKSIFKPERFLKQVDGLAIVLRPAVADESPEKLARFDKVVAGETVEPAPLGGPGGGAPPPGFGGSPRPSGPGGSGRPGGPGGFGGPGGMFQPPHPIKTFVTARNQAVRDQLDGRSEGKKLEGMNRRMGPGMFLAPPILEKADGDKDGKITASEFHGLAEKWFGEWDKEKTGKLTADQLRDGIGAAFPLPPGFGPPAGGPRPPAP